MLIEFTVGNFRSFKEPVTLSMVAAKIKARNPKVNENNTIIIDNKLTLLTSAAIYGANASGKSNLVRALAQMRRLVLSSSKESQADEPIDYHPFLLSTVTENKPSLFQVIFRLDDGITYRYGFEVDDQRVNAEWLFYTPTTKEARLFIRENNEVQLSRNFKEGKGLEEKTRPNALFLSVAAQWNGTLSTKILKWFRMLAVISGLDDMLYRDYTEKSFADGKLKEKIVELVKELDLGISDIFSEEIDKSQIILPKSMPDEIKTVVMNNMDDRQLKIKTVHTKWDAQGKPISSQVFELGKNESEGTQKLFYLAGPLLDSLQHHRILIIDEMEARLHPLMTRAIIQKFNSIESNPQRAQLIFTTHDTNLLSNKCFRRDQIWFIEKDRQGSSHLYSLAEIKVRNDASFEDDYIEGRYGAIPYLGKMQQIDLSEE
jgi:AAA15 family ATPase/GTPase